MTGEIRRVSTFIEIDETPITQAYCLKCEMVTPTKDKQQCLICLVDELIKPTNTELTN